jgi:RimJ/RimL family protein N-acetyltransferase
MRLLAYEMPRDAHPALVEALRVLYIEALADLSTRPLIANTPEQQQTWWANLSLETTTIWLLSEPERPWDIIGFVKLTHREGGIVTPMFALAKRVHGKGYGREVIQFYLHHARYHTLRGTQLVSNKAICHLNKLAGWVVVSEADGVQHLFHRNDSDYPERVYNEIMRYHNGEDA